MWFQSPEYLHWTRMFMLTQENHDALLSYINLQENDRILDVGCGTGEFTRYVAEGLNNHFTGVDQEEEFISVAQSYNSENIEYLCADAINLPFEHESFDVVLSHTFFTGTTNPKKAMDEMKRVCKKGGKIISVTTDSFSAIPNSPGYYPKEHDWVDEFRILKHELDTLYMAEASKYIVGIRPENMPRFFSISGLKKVTVYQLGKFFSLSNASVDAKFRKEFLDAEVKAEITRAYLLSEEKRIRYSYLLEIRKNALNKPENAIWEWIGGSNLVLIGINS